MKILFIFGHCRNMLCRLLPLALKTFKFLACTDCTDSGESRKPCKASYSTRQAGNIYDNFSNLTGIVYSDRDKGACNRYTLISMIIGSCKTGRRRLGGNSDRLFVAAFSLFILCFCVVGSAFPFCFFSFKIVIS